MELIFNCIFWLAGVFLLWRIAVIGSASGSPGRRRHSISVIIPARNEEQSLPHLLSSLAQQRLSPGEVLVVDDGSTDGTATVARAAGASVLSAGELPAGWLGKPWACWQGASKSRGDLLLFLDADVTMTPDATEKLVATWEARSGLVSVQPYHATRRAYEQLSAVFNIVLMMGMQAFTPFRERLRPIGAFGPCVLCARADYFAAGGHQVAHASVLEDLALGRAFQQAGMPVHCLAGGSSVSFRMYPGGIRQLLDGWSRSFGSGATRTPPLIMLLIVAWISGASGATVMTSRAALGLLSGAWSLQSIGAVVLYLLFAAEIAWMLRRIGSFRRWASLLYPVPLAFFVAVFVRSLVLTLVLRRVRWKDRSIQISNRVRKGRDSASR